MKLWIDDVRPAPEGYEWVRSVNQAKEFIEVVENAHQRHITDEIIELIDIDHDAGDYVSDGGDYIKLLDWLEETGRSYPIRIHSKNPVGVERLRAVIEHNGWEEVYEYN